MTSSHDVIVLSADRTVLEMIPLNLLTSKTYKITPKTLLYDFYSLVNKWGTLVPPGGVALNRQIFYLGFSKVELAGSWGYDPDSTGELTVLPKPFVASGVRKERIYIQWVGWDGMGGEGEGSIVREQDEENISEPMKFLKIILRCG